MLLAMSHLYKGPKAEPAQHDHVRTAGLHPVQRPARWHIPISPPHLPRLYKLHTEDSVHSLQSLQAVLAGFVCGHGMVQKLRWVPYFLYGWCRLLALHRWRARAPAQRSALLLRTAVLHDHRGSLGAGQQRSHVRRGTLSLPSPTLACLKGAAMDRSAHKSAHM